MLLSEPGKVIRCADHLQVLLALPAETIDLILAAPGKQEFFQKGRPSDYLFRRTAVELLRVLKPGGVLVWHVPNERGEATFSTAQFRQVINPVETDRHHPCGKGKEHAAHPCPIWRRF